MGKRVGLLAGLLVVASGTGAVAQEPSPEPPPWLGGRVEMPEYGFAVTLPDDWVTFDTSVDAVSQVEAASDFLDPVWWAIDDDAWWVDGIPAKASAGTELLSAHATSNNYCGIGVTATPDRSLADVAEDLYEDSVVDPLKRDVEPPRYIDLPAGPAYINRRSLGDESGSDDWWPSSAYILGMDGAVLWLGCDKSGARPDDDWLSIAETIELLPVEPPQPPPWFGGRVEMPEHGFAVTLPDDWVAFDTAADAVSQVETASDFLDPVRWAIEDDAAWIDGFAGLASRDVPLWSAHATTSSRCELGRLDYSSFAEAADDHLQWYLDDPEMHDVEPRLVALPTGTAYRIRMTQRLDSDSDEWWSVSAYLLDADETVIKAYCTTRDAGPDDDWLSIVETIEFLPTNE